MKIAIFETGNYHDNPDTIRVFSSVKKAIKNIPSGFKEIYLPSDYYYEDETNERWLSIKEYDVET